MKRLIVLMIGLSVAGFSQAQYVSMKNAFKIGVMGGVAVPSRNAVANAAIDLAYQNLVTPHVGIGIATGYNHFFGQDREISDVTLQNNSFGVVPVAALFRYYPQERGIYLGTDLGYGFLTGDENVVAKGSYNAERPGGGFYLKPELGYHNRNWNIFAHYTKVFTGDDGTVPVRNDRQKFNAGSIGVGVAYNIGLGR